MPKAGNRRKKTRTHVSEPSEEEKKAPRSMVFRRGKVGISVISLIHDLRTVMEPYTARKLQESKRNKLKDFVSIAGPLGVTHFMIFRPSVNGINLRFLRLPRGPTLTFRLLDYSLAKDVKAMQKRPHSPDGVFQKSPLVVLNNFSGDSHLKVASAMFQNMFPAINVTKTKLASQRRVVLFSYDATDDCVYFRHFLITASPVGLTKTVKKIIKAKIPDLSKYDDISDYVLRGDNAVSSDSEVDDTPESRVVLPQDFSGRGNVQSHKSAIRLKELGPRMKLQLIKIEEGINDGLVIYHKFQSKTPEEIEQLTKRKEEAQALRTARRLQQEKNVKRKQQLAEEKKARKRSRQEQQNEEDRANDDDVSADDEREDEGTDDEEYYRREVGELPQPGTFSVTNKKSKRSRI